jgi:hypothetical protein
VLPDEALDHVLLMTGLHYPRGLIGDEIRALARALADGGAGDVEGLAAAASAAHWPELRGAMEAGVRRGLSDAAPDEAEAFDRVLEWAGDPDPDNPLARALAVRAATELLAAEERAAEALRAAEAAAAAGGPGAAVAAATAAGAIAVDLLDLDPEDYEPEILAYVSADGSEDALVEFARATGDLESREWAREAVAGVAGPGAPAATAAVRHLASGPPPEDPAEDLVWVPTMLALAQQAIELAATTGLAEADDEGDALRRPR